MGETQIIDGLDDEQKRFMHQLQFPTILSVGSTGRYGPGRREIGHGALGERALEQVLPSLKTSLTLSLGARSLGVKRFFFHRHLSQLVFLLLWRVVSNQGIVAGIAMGLISDGTNYNRLDRYSRS